LVDLSCNLLSQSSHDFCFNVNTVHGLCVLCRFKCPTSLQFASLGFNSLLQDLDGNLLTAVTFHGSCVATSVSCCCCCVFWYCRVCSSNSEWAQCFLASCNASCGKRRISQALCITYTQSMDLTNWTSHWLNTNQLVSNNGWHNTSNHGKNHAVQCGNVAGTCRTCRCIFFQVLACVLKDHTHGIATGTVQTFEQCFFGFAPATF